ncbi:MAG: ankyrin repeat domain-containing protein [Bacteroidota bacterium]
MSLRYTIPSSPGLTQLTESYPQSILAAPSPPLLRSILRKLFRTHLPPGLSVGSGYISGCQEAFDLLIYDDSQGLLFDDGGMIIAWPQCVRGLIKIFAGHEKGVGQSLKKMEQAMTWLQSKQQTPIWSAWWSSSSDGLQLHELLHFLQREKAFEGFMSTVMLGDHIWGRRKEANWTFFETEALRQHDPAEKLFPAALHILRTEAQNSIFEADTSSRTVNLREILTIKNTHSSPISHLTEQRMLAQAGLSEALSYPTGYTASNTSSNATESGPQGNNVLHQAILQGRFSEVEKIVSKDISLLPVKNQTGMTALHLAAKAGNVAVVDTLIKAGADLNCRNFVYETPLHLASVHGHEDVINLLHASGAEIEARNNRSHTPLHSCAISGSAKGTAYLVRHGADLHALMEKDMHPLHLAAWYGQSEVVDVLIDSGANINAVNEHGNTPLHFAAFNGQVKVIKVLISHEADPNILNHEGADYLDGFNEGYQGDRLALLE